ncbi:MAG: NHLP family bacteriocin export ABC transporter peptidase/permease/ATPase subunit [Lachnospiraceae bacterium]|nr:NHLP family bacteriocin export ABC transporter peptidase/permease/ATPase subunit [Lachnospiraceae bacterium]
MEKKTNKKPVKGGVAKVPVVMQMEALECGAACLTMVMAYYDKWVPLEQVRSDCGISRDGSNARNILKAARFYGFTAGGYKTEPEDLKREGTFPCIIHWEFNHFVVLDGFKGNKVYLNDPARGSYSISMEAFDKGFTGICLMFEPGENFEPGGRPKSILQFARKRLQGAGGAVFFVILTTVITALIGIIRAGFSRVFLDVILTGLESDWLIPFIAALAILSIIQLISEWATAVYSLRINGKMAVVGSTAYMWKVLRLPMDFFSQRMAGDIQERQNSNATVANDLVYAFAPILINAAMTVFYLVVMVRYSLFLTAVGLFTVVLDVFVSRLISKKRVNITRVMMREQGKLAGTTVSGIEMIETIKASGAENGFFGKWSGYQAGVNTQNVRFKKIDTYLGMIPEIVAEIADISVLIVGVYLVMEERFTPGMIMVFQGFMASFMGPVESLISTGQQIQEMRSEMERIEDVMEYPLDVTADKGEEEEENSSAPKAVTAAKSEEGTGAGSGKKAEKAEKKSYSKLSGTVSMHNVTFGYSKLGEPLIQDFNLELKQGSRVAFVGASGCGKSTLSKLISGLYQPWEGEILFDGKKVTEIDRSVFTGSIAVVDQDIILFEDTIANNIKMWDNSIEDFEMILAARDAQIHEDIMEREGGYQYRITEGGKDFSGGQRQRLEIARVLAQDPTIIILDEATSALDARTEYETVKAIKDRGITCIVVAHRLSTIRDSDEIIVMDRGKVMERGTHDELMALNGMYTELITSE